MYVGPSVTWVNDGEWERAKDGLGYSCNIVYFVSNVEALLVEHGMRSPFFINKVWFDLAKEGDCLGPTTLWGS